MKAVQYRRQQRRKAVAQGLLLVLSALTAPVTLLAGQEVADRRVGFLAGLWVALDPSAWIFYGGTLVPDCRCTIRCWP